MTKIEENIVNIAMRAAMLLHTGQIEYDGATGHVGMTESIISLAAQFEEQNADVDFNEPEAKDYWEEIDRFADDKLLWLYGAAEESAPEFADAQADSMEILLCNESSTEELNVQLFFKMNEELNGFRVKPLQENPDEMLRSAYDLAIREDILLAMESNDLEPEQAAALLALDEPLKASVQAFECMDSSNHMEEMWQAIESAANTQLAKAESAEAGNHCILRETDSFASNRNAEHRYNVVVYHSMENGFDSRGDYKTLKEAERAAEGFVDGTKEPDGFQFEGSAIYDYENRKYIRIYGYFPDENACMQVAAAAN